MPGFLYRLPQNIATIFKSKNLLWQGIMITLTALLVLSGADWWWLTHTRNVSSQLGGFSAAGLGFIVPVILPVLLYLISYARKNIKLRNAAHASVQAALLGLGISSLYKVFTGRPGPHYMNAVVDTSHIWRFGFYRGGAFQGWPSSHTAVAFAMSFALITIFPKNKWVTIPAFLYALYIGFGVSVSIHWFSDFVAGVILGTIIGIAVGKAFLDKIKPGT